MLFTSPLWLIALVPWSAVVLWLLRGRRDRVGVPFIDLWRGEILQPRPRRSLQPPSISIGLILLACLLAILAAARPRIGWARSGASFIVIVDRGITMSAAGGDGSTRFGMLAGSVWREIAQEVGQASVSLHTVPRLTPIETDTYNWYGNTAAMPPTAVDTRGELCVAIRRALTDQAGGVVIVLSDRKVAIKSDRVIQIVPEAGLENVGIAHVAARGTPKPQVMVRLHNGSAESRAILEVSHETHLASRQIELPARGTSRDYFVDLPALSQSIEIAISGVTDGLIADNRAWLVRQSLWPRIEALAALPPEVTRVVHAYRKSRPAGAESPSITVVSNSREVPLGTSAIVVAAAGGTIGAAEVVATVVDHPITRHVDWSSAVKGARLSSAPANWTPLVSVEGLAVVAIQEGAARRVWMGLDSAEFARSPEFVMFWTDALDWLGAEGPSESESYGYDTVGALGAEWEPSTSMPSPRPLPGEWPGLYRRRDDSALRALNASIVDPETVQVGSVPGDWREKLRRWSLDLQRKRGRSLASPMIVLAVAALAFSAITWGVGRSHKSLKP